MCEPVFAPASDEDIAFLEKISASDMKLTELYTSLKILKPSPYIGTLWCGKIDGEIKEVIYENGCYTMHYTEEKTYIYRDGGDILNRELTSKSFLCFMKYQGKIPEEDSDVIKLDGRGFRDIYLLARNGETLSEKTEKRCLYSMLCFNRRLSQGFALFNGNRMLSTACVVAANEKYALIGNVFTAAEFRGRGLASKTVLAAVKDILDSRLTPVLICEKELVKFYERLGFITVD